MQIDTNLEQSKLEFSGYFSVSGVFLCARLGVSIFSSCLLPLFFPWDSSILIIQINAHKKNKMNISVMVSDSFLSLNVTCSVFKLNILVMQIGTLHNGKIWKFVFKY